MSNVDQNSNQDNVPQDSRYGVSFAPSQCRFFELDPELVLTKLLAAGFRLFRISCNWNQIEKRPGEYDFSEIEWQLNMIASEGGKAIVTVGMKAQRYPEYYIPSFYKDGFDQAEAFIRSLDAFLTATMKRLMTQQCIIAWQVENEPLDPSGPKQQSISPELLQREVKLVRSIDNSHRQIMVNLWGNSIATRDSWRNLLEMSGIDQIGLDIYPRVWRSNKLARFFLGSYAAPEFSPEQFARLTAQAQQAGKQLFLAELQAEPWEQGDYRQLAKTPSMDFDQILENVQSYSLPSYNYILLWGAEYWVWKGWEIELFKLLRSAKIK